MKLRKIHSWGIFPRVLVNEKDPQEEDIQRAISTSDEWIARGNGRSYGDASLSNTVINSRHLKGMSWVDESQGIVKCQSGVLLDEVLKWAVPQGYFLPVSPGTKFVTIGGAFASDIHGKNHHKEGVFSDHVHSITLIQGSNQLTELSPNDDLFDQTAGGMGLTGFILDVTFRLKPIETAYIQSEAKRAPNLKSLFQLFEQNEEVTYTMAWIDCLKQGNSAGRGVFIKGEHALETEVNKKNKLKLHPENKFNIPFYFPKWILNDLSIKLFNFLYYFKPSSNQKKLVHYDPFFYPLDGILNWNRMYGKNGFLQYQFVLPKDVSYEGVKQVLSIIAQNKCASFLSVLKLFGPSHEHRYLHFPMKGYTLALDIKISSKVWKVLEQIDAIVLNYGGKVYLTKDARMKADTFHQMYSSIPAQMTGVNSLQIKRLNNKKMSQKSMLVIGGNSDIAKATIKAYLQKYPEARVIMTARDLEAANKFVSENQIAEKVDIVELDLLKSNSFESFVKNLPVEPNWVFVSAGLLNTNSDSYGDEMLVDQAINVNFSSPVMLLNLILKHKSTQLKRIIGMSSIAALKGRKSNYYYGATKAGFHQFLFGLRQDLSDKGVTVQAISPGVVRTKMTKDVPVSKVECTPEDIAKSIMKESNKFEVYPNFFWWAISRVIKWAPEFIIKKL